MRDRKGGFSGYSEEESLEVVGFTTCGGCPGGNIEYAPEEMVNNGAEAIHLATGLVVGYPPCPWLEYFVEFIQEKYGVPVVVGAHPIPEQYLRTHDGLPSKEILRKYEDLVATQEIREAYE